MLSLQPHPTPLSTIYNPHTNLSTPGPLMMAPSRPRRALPKLSLSLPTLSIPPAAVAPSTPTTPTSASGMMSPTSRNTAFNRRITAPRNIVEVRCDSESEGEGDCEEVKRRDGGMRSIHHPVTPRTGFFPGFKVQKREAVGGKGKRRDRKVGFSDDVVVHILKMEEEEKGENEVEEGKDVEMNEE